MFIEFSIQLCTMDNYKISVIVPVYNVAKYLHRCIDSIIGQSYKNLEIIIVDDGSTDGSSEICNEYQSKDFRIRVFHKPNGGLSSARNFGIEHATGSYLSFIDSDDWIKKEFYEKLSVGMKCGADVIDSDYSIEYNNRIFKMRSIIDAGRYSRWSKLDNYVIPLIRYGKRMQVWNKLYSSKFFFKMNIRFISEREVYMEDDVFNTMVFILCENLFKVNTTSYVHHILKGSLSQSYRQDLFKMLLNKRKVKEAFLSSKSEHALLDILNKTEIDDISYGLYRESLCNYKLAKKNILKICDYSQKKVIKEERYEGKYRILYKLSKKRLYTLIIILSKGFKLCEPLYRWYNLRKLSH